jgi:hypothetical protein
VSRHWTTPCSKATLETRFRYFVEVCRFTFEFFDLEDARRYLEFFRAKVRPSSRKNVREIVSQEMQNIARAARTRGEHITIPYGQLVPRVKRVWRTFIRAERGVIQSRFERLPMYLLKDKNRLRVVKALEAALEAWR